MSPEQQIPPPDPSDIVRRHYDPVYPESDKSPERFRRESENRDNMARQVDMIVGSYAGLYPMVVPHKRGPFGKWTGIPRPWTIEKPIGNYRASVRTRLHYDYGKTESRLEKADILIRPASDPETWTNKKFVEINPALELRYVRGQMVSIIFHRVVVGDEKFKSMFSKSVTDPNGEPNKLGAFLDTIIDPGVDWQEYDIAIDVSDSTNPSLLLNPVLNYGHRREYVYDPDTENGGRFLLVDSPDPVENGFAAGKFPELLEGLLAIAPFYSTMLPNHD